MNPGGAAARTGTSVDGGIRADAPALLRNPVPHPRAGAGLGKGRHEIGPIPHSALSKIEKAALIPTGLLGFGSQMLKVLYKETFGNDGDDVDVPVRSMVRVHSCHPEDGCSDLLLKRMHGL